MRSGYYQLINLSQRWPNGKHRAALSLVLYIAGAGGHQGQVPETHLPAVLRTLVHHCLPHLRRGLPSAPQSIRLSPHFQPRIVQRVRLPTTLNRVGQLLGPQNNKLSDHIVGRLPLSIRVQYCGLQDDIVSGSFHGLPGVHALF